MILGKQVTGDGLSTVVVSFGPFAEGGRVAGMTIINQSLAGGGGICDIIVAVSPQRDTLGGAIQLTQGLQLWLGFGFGYQADLPINLTVDASSRYLVVSITPTTDFNSTFWVDYRPPATRR